MINAVTGGIVLVPRRVNSAVTDALTDTRVVLIAGSRQVGKSTLAQLVAQDRVWSWFTLDDESTLRVALDSPGDFVAQPTPMVIDEIQRAPELLLAIKSRVDRDRRPGQFLLTGSAQVFALRGVPDTLVGRVETVELWPFSQGEIDGALDGFVDVAFRVGPDVHHTSTLGRRDYAERVVRGGFPESVARTRPERRERFLDAYARQVVERDVARLAEIERVDQMQALLRLVAARSGQLLVPASLGNAIRLHHTTVSRYLTLLHHIFMIKTVPAWSRNLSTRVTGAPKVAFVDSGLAARLCDAGVDRLARPDGPLGPLLEGFVMMELARQLTWSQERAVLSHYRTRDGVEVDAVLENGQGQVVAIEVKASATVRSEDFSGLRHLQQRLGEDFLLGVVLYTGAQTLPFGPRLRALPVSALWQLGG